MVKDVAPGGPALRMRFYAELNDHLPRDQRATEFACRAAGGESLKDLLERLGVPHAAVDLVLVNGASVDLSHVPRDGDRISVYPVFESFDIRGVTRVRAAPLRRTRFVLDPRLARLAALLRGLGFDALCCHDYGAEDLVRISLEEGRILLTPDRVLPAREEVARGYCVTAAEPHEQLQEVVGRFDLAGSVSAAGGGAD